MTIVGTLKSMDSSEIVELSKTALSVSCKICGGLEEDDKRFLICGHSLCMYKYYHIRCLKPDQIASDAQLGKPCWYCPSCLCRVCLIDMDDDKIILCDGCDEGHHLYCLSPPRSSVPEGEWRCPFCNAETAREGRMRKYEERMLKLHRKDGAMLKSDKHDGLALLLSAVEILTAGEGRGGEDEKLTAKEQSGDCGEVGSM